MKKIKKILNFIVNIILLIVTVISIVLLFQILTNKNEVPNFFNHKFFIITSGSMEPTIKINDFIIIKEKKIKDIQIYYFL